MTLTDVREKLVATLRPDVFRVEEDFSGLSLFHGSAEGDRRVALRITTRDPAITIDWIEKHFSYAQATKASARRIEKLRKRGFDRGLQLAFDDLDRSTDALMMTLAALRQLAPDGWTYYRWNSTLWNEADKKV